ncbi:MAG: hypothetical protein ABI039_01815 [Vicinamibacterales bacterium]
MKPLIVCVVWVATAGSAVAQDRVLGLLSLPEVFGARVCAPFEPGEVALYAAPHDDQAVAFIRVDQNWSFAPHGGCEGLEVSIHRGEHHEELPRLEYDYEMPGAIVVDRREGWFEIRLKDKPAWVKASSVNRFMPLADLYEEFVGVTAISQDFTGRLLGEPGVLTGPIMPRVSPSQSVRVIELREARGQQWVNVDVLNHSACTAASDARPRSSPTAGCYSMLLTARQLSGFRRAAAECSETR